MNWKIFSDTGHKNPANRESIDRLNRSYPIKRSNWGMTQKDREKQVAAIKKNMEQK